MKTISQIVTLSLILSAFLSSLPSHSQTCPQPFVLRQEACPSGASTCSTKGSSLTYQQLDRDIINTIGLCNGPGQFTWPAPSTGFIFSTSGTISHVSASGVGSCTNQLVSALNNNAAPTCSSVSAAMMASGVLGWTDNGSTVTLTASSDLAGIGGTPTAQLHIQGTPSSAVEALKVASTITSATAVSILPIINQGSSSLSILGVGGTVNPTTTLGTVFGTSTTTAIGGSSSNNITDVRSFSSRVDTGSSYAGTITNAYAYFAASPSISGGTITNVYSFYGNVASASNRWNAFMAGTANNYFAGNVGIGTTSFGASSANGVLSFGNGATCPSAASADTAQICATDTSAGDTNLYAQSEAGVLERFTGLRKRVKTQFDSTSDTTLDNVTDLSFNVESGKSYGFTIVLFTTSNVSGGIKASVGGTATATSIVYDGDVKSGATIAQTRATALGTTVCGVTAVTSATCEIKGTITVNAGGTLTAQAAQNASNGTATSVLVGSRMYLEPIAN